MSLKKWNYDLELDQLGKPVNKSNWGFTITVDAWNNGKEVFFPAGILQFPFFDPNADDAVNYGAIGITIGHELSHSFDLNGSQFDADGAQRNWWTDEDRSRFDDKTKALVIQYNNYTVQGIPVNGRVTLNENIADLCGMTVAYDAFKMTEQGQSTTLIDGLTPDQRFFLSRAQICRENMLPQAEITKVTNDNHAPLKYRLIGVVVNHDAWYNAFQINATHKLYKKPEERIIIW
jgi:putative endopeptidase